MSICSFGYLRMMNFFDIKRTLYGERKKIYLKKSFFQLFLRVSYKESTQVVLLRVRSNRFQWTTWFLNPNNFLQFEF